MDKDEMVRRELLNPYPYPEEAGTKAREQESIRRGTSQYQQSVEKFDREVARQEKDMSRSGCLLVILFALSIAIAVMLVLIPLFPSTQV